MLADYNMILIFTCSCSDNSNLLRLCIVYLYTSVAMASGDARVMDAEEICK